MEFIRRLFSAQSQSETELLLARSCARSLAVALRRHGICVVVE
jgi:hypothetical protein